MEIKHVAVIGAGFMGSGIAQVSAQAGYSVSLIDIAGERLSFACASIEWSLAKLETKGQLNDRAATVAGRIRTSTDYHAAARADLVVEAVFENVDTKLETVRALDAIVRPDSVIGSNTSTIPITTLAGASSRPERVIGIHFFGPVPLMRLVEITPNPKTSQDVIDAVLAFGASVGKRPVLVKKDVPGFIMNRIFGSMTCEAVRLVEDGIGTIEDIDQGMCDGFNLRVGPLCIADLAGLDIALNAFQVMHDLDPARMPAPPALLARMVAEGKLGAKSGEGFYRWEKNGKRLGAAF
ncbi:MAG: 3-hydroxyacyl-CoA dehydrogenase family protein [Candidatus Hydrogenedentes bacterium]|nr:3-hydroxyacyl-CoA dehydrogenase family protein [Candidatus Hydrogenedentota bacterium]